MERSGSNRWRRALVAPLVGVLLYAGTSWVTAFAQMSNSVIAGSLRPGVAIPIFFGLVFGPLTGFVVGFGGNLLADMITGAITLPISAGSQAELVAILMLNWQLGNGLMGLVAGLAALRGWRYCTPGALLKALLLTLLAIAVGIGVAAALDPLVYPASYPDPTTVRSTVLRESFIPITLANWINAAVIVPILLFNYERLDQNPLSLFRSGLMRRVLLTIVISAAVPIILLGLFLFEANAGAAGDWGAAFGGVFVNLTLTVMLTTVFIITNAALMAQSLTRPLLNLSSAARGMEQNTLSLEQAAELKATPGSDEIAQLSRVFGTMAQEVIQREQELRKHVQELQIIIDEHKRSDQVKEIVESDFFRDLKQKARSMRDRGKGVAEQADEQPA